MKEFTLESEYTVHNEDFLNALAMFDVAPTQQSKQFFLWAENSLCWQE